MHGHVFSRSGSGFIYLLAGLACGFCVPWSAWSAEMPLDLTEMSLEQLMDIEVTSVSKKPQKQFDAAAAVFVLTGDDLQRMGVTSIPQALRYVPGVQVGRLDSNKWSVSARGFNGRFANKLLVLIDGRSVYTPLFAGVYWEAQHVPIADIDRIEVIRGPGGTLWGANAVNGVINIITRNAGETQGGLLTAGAGDEERGFGSVRWGGSIGGAGHYRVYASRISEDEQFAATGSHDDWELSQGGFRADWKSGEADRFTLQGDVYDGIAGQQLTTPVAPGAPMGAPAALTTSSEDVELRGQNLLFRWRRMLSERSDWALQLYYDHVYRDGVVLYEDRDTFDLDFQYRLPWRESHDIVWGLGYRRIHDDTRTTELFSLSPAERSVDLFSAFVQDEIRFFEDRVSLILGSKFEHNDFTGFEVQPNLRAVWRASDRTTLWGAVSRAVRTPARGEDDVRLRTVPTAPALPTDTVTVQGADDFESEVLVAYELGYRFKPADHLTFDTSLFHNKYERLRTFDPVTASPAITIPFDNRMDGTASGLELAVQWQPHKRWRFSGAYTYFTLDLDPDPGRLSAASLVEDSSPSHQASIWAFIDLGHNLELNTGLRYVDDIQVSGIKVSSYVELDAKLAWKPRSDIELSLNGRNLLDSHHPEGVPTFIATQATEIDRSVFGALRWDF